MTAEGVEVDVFVIARLVVLDEGAGDVGAGLHEAFLFRGEGGGGTLLVVFAAEGGGGGGGHCWEGKTWSAVRIRW